jgi:hypothetical protein
MIGNLLKLDLRFVSKLTEVFYNEGRRVSAMPPVEGKDPADLPKRDLAAPNNRLRKGREWKSPRTSSKPMSSS